MPQHNAWPLDKTDRLLELWNAGKSALEISEAMGITRNAVLGRVHRIRLAGGAVKEHEKSERKERPRGLQKPAGRPREATIHLVKPKPLPPLQDTLEGSVTLFERTGCRWPVTASPPHRFCNRPAIEGLPYCEGHHVRAVQPKEMKRGKHEVPFR